MTLQTRFHNYEWLEKIGEGTCGVVYKAYNLGTPHKVRLKKLYADWSEGRPIQDALLDLEKLKLEHPNIVRIKSILMVPSEITPIIITDWFDLNLETYMKLLIETDQKLLEPQVKAYFYQLLEGVRYCHFKRLLHCDLNPNNVMVSPYKGQMKLSDCGLATTIQRQIRGPDDTVSMFRYRAPELLLGSLKPTTAVDMWSIGCIFAFICLGKPLFDGDSEIGIIFAMFRIMSTPTVATWKEVTTLPHYSPSMPQWKFNYLKNLLIIELRSADIARLLTRILVYQPEKRSSATALIDDPYFENLDRTLLPIDYYDLLYYDRDYKPFIYRSASS